jgi:hypothetical protein
MERYTKKVCKKKKKKGLDRVNIVGDVRVRD